MAAFGASALLTACSLFTSLDGLSGGAADGGEAGSSPDASRVDEASSGEAAADAGPSRYASAVLADEPLGYWRFGEANGRTAFNATASIPGTYAEFGVALGRAGAIVGDPDTAVELDGVDGRIDFGNVFDFAGRAPFTVELWIKPENPNGKLRLILSRGATAPEGGPDGYFGFYNTRVDGGAYLLFGRTSSGTASYAPGPAFTGTAFDHVVLTYDGRDTRLWFNGVNVGTERDERAVTPTAGAFVVGDSVIAQPFKFKGAMDELAVYDHALAADRIAAHLAAARGVPAP